ncbi:MAG: hypothetical protein CL868_02100 [Cytophagaceae bacterium]|nr:hypothetical protein [Cytophagaceae bacterium]|tara:strand:- start:153 stop:1292 length:1140 start_codon:yes stop_codon:yes gene_type:complete
MNIICYCCEEQITEETSSIEHILPNAIGGKLKSKELLCKDCNSNFGVSFDSELTKQLLFLSSFLNVKRDRGNHPKVKGGKTESGIDIDFLSGGKPYYAKPSVKTTTKNNEVVLDIMARDKKELKQILKGLSRKHPQIDIEEILSKSIEEKAYLNEPVKITQTIGGAKALNAITKVALNYCIYKTKSFKPFTTTINTLKTDSKNELSKHYHSDKPLYKKIAQEICHIIHIQSNKQNKNVIGYVEFFSSYSFIILLSDNYDGKNIKATYCYDLNSKKEIKKNINLKIATEDFNTLPIITPDYYPIITNKMDRIIKIGLKEQNDKALSNLISKCVDDIWKVKYGHEERVTKQMITKLSQHIAMEFVKFMYRGKKTTANNGYK